MNKYLFKCRFSFVKFHRNWRFFVETSNGKIKFYANFMTSNLCSMFSNRYFVIIQLNSFKIIPNFMNWFSSFQDIDKTKWKSQKKRKQIIYGTLVLPNLFSFWDNYSARLSFATWIITHLFLFRSATIPSCRRIAYQEFAKAEELLLGHQRVDNQWTPR